MTLLENWKSVLTKAWSVRLGSLATVLEIALQLLPEFGSSLPQWLVIALLVGAVGSRLVAQEGLSKPDPKEAAVAP